MGVKHDFCGYATKNNLKCSDGRVIRHNAFKDNDGQTVPLVWQHRHNEPTNVLGHVKLENREDGVYAYGKFNKSQSGMAVKEAVEHGDITMMSIYANNLIEKGADVVHGVIREVSLVLSGANPGARIESFTMAHSDGTSVIMDDDEAIIYTGETLAHEEDEEDDTSTSDDDRTIQDVFDSMDEVQQTVVYAMVAEALNAADPDDTSTDEDDEIEHSDEGGTTMNKNVFEENGVTKKDESKTLSHSQIMEFNALAYRNKASLRDTILQHAPADYGIDGIEILFPEAKTLRNEPDVYARRKEWVQSVLGGAHKSPFSRIRSFAADLTQDEARARGYIKTNRKWEEVFPVMSRVTTPQTIYKKQKLDRDDIIDITDFNVVTFVRGEMRVMLDEEMARAILFGDGRDVSDESKIKPDHIRPIATEDDVFCTHIDRPQGIDGISFVDDMMTYMQAYRGSGSPTMYVAPETLAKMMITRDELNHRLYRTKDELATALGVSNIVSVELMSVAWNDGKVPLAIVVNMSDYTIGADKGGQVSMFDDFDIDYNQYKYLLETRFSGCLTLPKSAIVIEKTAAKPTAPPPLFTTDDSEEEPEG